MEIAYVAHAARAALFLDEDGICRRVVPSPGASAQELRAAHRAVGAQFVASLDGTVEGYLHHQPRVGAAMLFSEMVGGRAALVRFGPLLQFDDLGGPVVVTTDDEASALVLRLRTPLRVPVPIAPTSDATMTGIFARDDSQTELLRVVASLAADASADADDGLEPTKKPSSDEGGIEPGIGDETMASAAANRIGNEPASADGGEEEDVRPSGVSSREPSYEGSSGEPGGPADCSAETCQFSYAVMGSSNQRADAAWPQALMPPRLPRRLG